MLLNEGGIVFALFLEEGWGEVGKRVGSGWERAGGGDEGLSGAVEGMDMTFGTAVIGILISSWSSSSRI